MSFELDVTSKSKADIAGARKWYEQEQVGVGEKFLEAIKRTFEQICERPETFPIIHKDVRFAKTDPFPYVVYFQIVGRSVLVSAVVHARRHPRVWRSRL